MKKKFILFLVLLSPSFVYATSGWLKSDSIVTCNGQTYGKHSDSNPHWHIAIKKDNYWYATGDEIYSNPCENSYSSNSTNTQTNNSETSQNSNSNNNTNNNNASNSNSETSNNTNNNNSNIINNNTVQSNNVQTQTTTATQIKSGDNTLKSVIIDKDSIEIADIMTYDTNKENVDIEAIANDSDATVKVNNHILYEGDNKIKITVTAEDKTQKNYNINIYRKSSNTELIIKYNNKTLSFDKDCKNDTITTNNDTIKFDIEKKSDKTTTDIKDSYNLKNGANTVIITATAEDGTTQKYTINIKKEDTSSLAYKIENFIGTIIAIAILLLPAFLIIFIVKKFLPKKCKKYKKVSKQKGRNLF